MAGEEPDVFDDWTPFDYLYEDDDLEDVFQFFKLLREMLHLLFVAIMADADGIFNPHLLDVSPIAANSRPSQMVHSGSSEESSFEATWAELSNNFRLIHTRNASDLSYEQLYRLSYRVVLKKQSAELYAKVVGFERSWLKQDIFPQIQELLSPSLLVPTPAPTNAAEHHRSGEAFLRGIKQHFREHSTCMAMMSDALMYLVWHPTFRNCTLQD